MGVPRAAPKPNEEAECGFVLTRQHWDRAGEGVVIRLWLATEKGPLRVVFPEQKAVMFIDRDVPTEAGTRKEVNLRTLEGRPVDALYFDTQRGLREARRTLHDAFLSPLESDIRPADRFLMERFITGGVRASGTEKQTRGVREMTSPRLAPSDVRPALKVMYLDLETDGLEGALLSFAFVHGDTREVWIKGEPKGAPHDEAGLVRYAKDEKALIEALCARVTALDPDALCGWNFVEFDMSYLFRRAGALGISLSLGRGGERCVLLEPQSAGDLPIVRIPGRVVIDAIAALRTATYSFDSFRLEDVAQTLLGRGKAMASEADAVAAILRMYETDHGALATYNLRDCELVRDIAGATNLIDFLMERQQLTGLPMDRAGGSVAAFDYLYLPRLHRHGYVAPDVGHAKAALMGAENSPGGYVLDSTPGLYRNVLVFDFKSLYPSIIRTFLIDPLGLADPGDDPIEGFIGATFHREAHILPGLIETLWRARDAAKRDKDTARSTAIKILMNSFYGVLGTPGCRFFDPKLASSITLRGHEIITTGKAWFEAQGLSVIYGDTDSLFVWANNERSAADCQALGTQCAEALNAHFAQHIEETHRTKSALELEFETHYERFVMPTMRHSEKGSKKRYAGLVRERDGSTRLVFKGLEAVRTDWTPLARDFQRELYRRVFHDEPFEPLVRETARALKDGRLDASLAYTKRLRRTLDSYERNVPPHVQAARKLKSPGRRISYVMTTRGPEPVGYLSGRPDYEHYLERQLAPAADGLLQFLGTSFDAIAGAQMSLF